MNPENGEFNLTSPESREIVRPKEPLQSMLLECPASTLKYIHDRLIDFQSETQLEDQYPEVGLCRREFIEQVQLAMNSRGANIH